MGGQPARQDSFFEGLLDLGVLGGHPVAGAAVDDHGFLGAEPAHRARGVDRGVATAVDDHPSAEQRRVFVLDVVQQADREQDGVEAPPEITAAMAPTAWPSSRCTPVATMRSISASSTSRGSRKRAMSSPGVNVATVIGRLGGVGGDR